MIRLALQLEEQRDAYLAAASRIAEVVIHEGHPEAIISDRVPVASSSLPVLLVGGVADNAFPALPWRFSPQARSIRASVDAGDLGRPGLLRLHVWESAEISHADKVGAIDLVLWLFGAVPTAIHGRPGLAHLGFAEGGMAMIDFHDRLPPGEGYRSLSLIGSEGAAYADDHHDRNLIFAGGAPRASPPDTGDHFRQAMLEDFIAKVRQGTSPAETLTAYREAERIVLEAGA